MGAGVEVQEEVLEAVQDAVEEFQGEVPQEVQVSEVVDQLPEEQECLCWGLRRSVLAESV